MPPKHSAPNNPVSKPTKQEFDAIKKYIAQKPDFDKLIAEAKANPTKSSDLPEPATDYDRKITEAVKESLAEHRKA